MTALQQFLEAGEADEDLAEEVEAEVEGDKELGYIGEMMKEGEPPIILTDGSVESGEDVG